jgi:Fe-Mn family superoxide dismutase
MEFTAKTFNIPELKGMSAKSIEEHLKLYAGSVKHANLLLKAVIPDAKSPEESYMMAETFRRFGFEFGGIRNHEIYFGSLEGGACAPNPESALSKAFASFCGSIDVWIAGIKKVAMTRGPGWVMLGYDPVSGLLLHHWVDEQHVGHLPGLTPLLAIDLWEHSYVADYQPSGKAQYVEDFFANLNWKFVEDRFDKAQTCVGH